MPTETEPTIDDSCTRHNVAVESAFSACNGIVLGLAFFASPTVARYGFNAGVAELTLLAAAFPLGTLLGPVWGRYGQRYGMRNLVNTAGILGSLPMFLVFWVQPDQSALFTALMVVAQLFISAMRVGQSSLYRVNYGLASQGRIIGWLNSCNYFTMIPSTLLTGWLIDNHPGSYRFLYVAAGGCGLLAAVFYRMLILPTHVPTPRVNLRASLHKVERVLTEDRVFRYFQLAFFFAGAAFFMSRHIVLYLMDVQFHFNAEKALLWLTVMPQLVLVVSSPIWGWVIDHLGILKCRLLICSLIACYMASFCFGFMYSWVHLIYIGCIIHGIESGGGQLTWWMASSFAPRHQDAPMYTSIHFVLNGVRGIFMPWAGSALALGFGGVFAIVGGFALAALSIPFALRSLTVQNQRNVEPVPPPVATPELQTVKTPVAKPLTAERAAIPVEVSKSA